MRLNGLGVKCRPGPWRCSDLGPGRALPMRPHSDLIGTFAGARLRARHDLGLPRAARYWPDRAEIASNLCRSRSLFLIGLAATLFWTRCLIGPVRLFWIILMPRGSFRHSEASVGFGEPK